MPRNVLIVVLADVIVVEESIFLRKELYGNRQFIVVYGRLYAHHA